MTDPKKTVSSKLLWLDLEMTGLDPQKHRIIEVAAVITDWDFNELATFEAVIKQPQKVLDEANEWSRLQHMASGLFAKVHEGLPELEVEKQICELVAAHFGDEPALLAGNSIHQDRQFIRRWWPKLEAKLHYRMLDVSAWKVVMMGKFHEVYAKKEGHRALNDIRESIEELQFYLKKMNV